MKKILLPFILGMLCVNADSNAQVTIYSQDFEGATVPALPTGWTNASTGTPGWKTRNSATVGWPLTNVGAHTTYALLDAWNDSTTNNTSDILVSPVISLASATTPYLSFDYDFHQAYRSAAPTIIEKVIVVVSTNGGTSWTNVDSLMGTGGWTSHVTNLSSYAGQANFKVGFRYGDYNTHLLGAAIDNVLLFTPPAEDISLTAVTPAPGSATAYGLTSGTIALGGTVKNLGANAITSYNVYYQLGSSAVQGPFAQSGNIAPFTTGTFSGINMTLPSTVGASAVKVWVTLTGDANHANDSANTNVGAAAFMPTKKLLVEEQTGTWCGWCVRGIVYMDSLRTLYHNNISLIAVHNSDPMTVTAYDSWATSFPGFTGFPSVIVDRRELGDPQDLLTIYNNEHAYFGFADLTVSSPVISGTTYTDTVVVRPAIDLAGDYRVILAVTEDQVHNTGGGTWDQHNYYSSSSQNQPLTGQGINYQTLSNPIPSAQMYYNHVARAISPSPTGTTNLPSTLTNSTNYSVVVSATISSTWAQNNLVGVVMLVRGSDGVVLNTQNLGAPWVYTAVTNINEGINKVLVFPNPANDVAYVTFDLSQETRVQVQVTDGVGRVVYTVPASQMAGGSHNITIPTSSFAAGLYNVSIQTEAGNITQHLSVVR